MGMYFLYKLWMRDYTYWPPAENGFVSAFISFILRFVNKTLADFCGLLQFRHPYELGGLMFTLNLVFSQVSAFACGGVYTTNAKDDGSKIPATALFSLLVVCFVGWVVGFCIFYFGIKAEYRRTFTDPITGWQFTVNQFINGNEFQKSQIFGYNHRHWVSIRGDVKNWTLSNWVRWQQDKPDWFTEDFIASVPDDFIPVAMDPNRRRSSLLKGFAGPTNPSQVQPVGFGEP